MSKWMWQAVASVGRELVKAGHAKLGAALLVFVVLCWAGTIVLAVLAGGKVASSGLEVARSQLQHKGDQPSAKDMGKTRL